MIYGSRVYTEYQTWPPWLSIVGATFWTSPFQEGLRARLRKPTFTPNIQKAKVGHINVKIGESASETAIVKVMEEEVRLEGLPRSYGCLVATFSSAPSFVCYLLEIARVWTFDVHNIATWFLLNSGLLAVTGQIADVRACFGNLKFVCSQDFFQF